MGGSKNVLLARVISMAQSNRGVGASQITWHGYVEVEMTSQHVISQILPAYVVWRMAKVRVTKILTMKDAAHHSRAYDEQNNLSQILVWARVKYYYGPFKFNQPVCRDSLVLGPSRLNNAVRTPGICHRRVDVTGQWARVKYLDKPVKYLYERESNICMTHSNSCMSASQMLPVVRGWKWRDNARS